MTLGALVLSLTFVPADLVVKNAFVWSDGKEGIATSFAVRGGVFVFVGDYDPSLVGSKTIVVDAERRLVLPGLIDSHIHMLGGGASLNQIQLRDAVDKRDFIERIRKWAKDHPEQPWVTGGRWSTESWADKAEPTKEWIDEAVSDRPVYLSRMDGHSAIANTMALNAADITKATADPPGGRIVRDEKTGEPTGLLRETATGLVSRSIPSKSSDQLKRDLVAAMKHANANGITSVSDIPPSSALDVYQDLARENGLTVRIALYPTMDAAQVAPIKKSFKAVTGWLELKGVKVYMDGTLGSRTAAMREPFLNNPADVKENRGLLMPNVTNGMVAAIAAKCRDNGLQLIGHAIGDEANHVLIGIFKNTWKDVRSARPRLEHAQHLLASDIPEIGRLGVVTSYQPFHKADDGRYAESYIGVERSNSSYAYKDVLDSGGVLAFGSDWPVVTLNPFLGIEAAMTGKTLAGQLWQTRNNVSIDEALRGYTSGAAYSMFWENKIGKIAPGFAADFVVLNESPFGNAPKWAEIKPLATYVGGKKVFGD